MSSEEKNASLCTRSAIAAALAALLVLLLVHLKHPLRIGFDQALYVYAGSLLLEGKKLYVDVVDINPPLISYLSMIPAAVSSVVNIPAPLAFSLCVWSLCCYCTAAVYLILQRARQSIGMLAPSVLVVAVPLVNLLMQSNRVDALFVFGQREHLFMLAYLPLFCLRFARQEGQSFNKAVAIAVGTIAGTFLCLKPFFFLIAVAVELFWVVEKKTWRLLLKPEIVAVAAVSIIYAVHFLFLPADVSHAYFQGVAMVGLAGYQVYDRPTIFLFHYSLVHSPPLFYLWVSAVALTLALARCNPFLPSLCALALASGLSYFMQRKGWPIHLIPVSVSTYPLLILLGANLCKLAYSASKARLQMPKNVSKAIGNFKLPTLSEPIKESTSWLAAVIAFAATGSIFFSMMQEQLNPPEHKSFDMAEIGYQGTSPEDDLAPFSEFIRKYTEPGDTVAFLNTSTEPTAALLLQLKRKPAGRHVDVAELCYFDFIREDQPEAWTNKFAKMQKEYIDTCIDDINESQPKLIILRIHNLKFWLEAHNFTKRVLDGKYKKSEDYQDCEIYLKQ